MSAGAQTLFAVAQKDHGQVQPCQSTLAADSRFTQPALLTSLDRMTCHAIKPGLINKGMCMQVLQLAGQLWCAPVASVKRSASVPYCSITSTGSTTLPSDLLILRPCASRTCKACPQNQEHIHGCLPLSSTFGSHVLFQVGARARVPIQSLTYAEHPPPQTPSVP